MMAKQLIFLLLAFVFVQLSASNERPEKFVGEIDGHHIEAPYYNPQSPDLGPERKKFDVESTDELRKIFKNMTDDTILNNKYVFQLREYPGKLINLFNNNIAEIDRLTKEGKSPDLSAKFVKESMRAFREILKAKGDEKMNENLKALPQEEFVKEIDALWLMLRNLIAANPKGKDLKWAEVTIDGLKLSEYIPPYLNYFRKRGYGFFMGMIDPALGIMEKFV